MTRNRVALGGKHCAAALWATAVAGKLAFRLFRDRFVDFQRVIVKEFLAGFDISHCVNKDAVVLLYGFAIRIAAMVNPASFVSADAGVNDLTVSEPENECVWIVLVVGRVFPSYALAGVFDNASAFRNEPRGVNAATVHTGFANFDPSVWSVLFNSTFLLVPYRKLLLGGAANLSQVLAKRVLRIGCSLVEVSRELRNS